MLRQIPWPGLDDGAEAAQPHVRCGDQRLWLVDAADEPGLWSIDLSLESPRATDHSTSVSGVGELVVSPDGGTLYYASQSGWGERQDMKVRAVETAGFTTSDEAGIGPSEARVVALDAPVFFDSDGARLVTRNRVIDASDLAITLFTFGAGEVLRAVDFERGRAASRERVYSLDDYRALTPTAPDYGSDVFFEADGTLRILVADPPRIVAQRFDD